MSLLFEFYKQNLRMGICSAPKDQNEANELAMQLKEKNAACIVRVVDLDKIDDKPLEQNNIKIHKIAVEEKQAAQDWALDQFFKVVDENLQSYYKGKDLKEEELKSAPMIIVQSKEGKNRAPYLVVMALIHLKMANAGALQYVREVCQSAVCNVAQINHILKFTEKQTEKKSNYTLFIVGLVVGLIMLAAFYYKFFKVAV